MVVHFFSNFGTTVYSGASNECNLSGKNKVQLWIAITAILGKNYFVSQKISSFGPIRRYWWGYIWKKNFAEDFLIKAKISCFWPFSAFLGVFETLYGVMTPPDQKKYQFLCGKKFGCLWGTVGSLWKKSKFYLIMPLSAPVGPKRAGIWPNP